jgi:XTP/dITP diphosphohydrolase
MINYEIFKCKPRRCVERKKTINRFQYLESKAGELGKPLMDMTLAEMDVLGRSGMTSKNRIGKSLIFKSFKFGKKEGLPKK